MSKKIRVVHYLNQFFGGFGGEEQAHQGPQIVDGLRGPGRAIQNRLAERGEVVATAICGDDYAGEKIEETADEIVRLIRPYHPDVVIAGPAFEAGRYGVACGAICKKVQEVLKIPVVTGMYAENPGVDLYHQDVYIVQTGDSVRTMDDAIIKMVNLAMKLAAGHAIDKPANEGYFPRGILVNEVCDNNGAARAVAMLLDKMKGRPFDPEVIQPTHYPVSAAPRIKDMRSSTIALVTDGGLVPAGNPDGIESKNATRFGGYDFKNMDSLAAKDYDINHSGYANVHTRHNPNRLIPVDAMREIEREKGIGKLHERFYSTTGVATRLEIARKMGRAIAAELKSEGVSGAILTSTWGTSTRCGAVLAKEIERAGIPTVQVTAMTSIALMIGVPRVVQGTKIVNPMGNEDMTPQDEKLLRRDIAMSALNALQAEAKEPTLFSRHQA